jgi:short-subunit dehydrogenase
MASPHHNVYHATKHFTRAFSEALSLELRAYPGIVNTQIMPGPTHTQWPTRADAEETVMFGIPGSTNDPKQVAMAAYEGLRKRKRMVFSSWGDAASALLMQIAPRSVHLTMAAFANSPTRGLGKMPPPETDQGKRGKKLEADRV